MGEGSELERTVCLACEASRAFEQLKELTTLASPQGERADVWAHLAGLGMGMLHGLARRGRLCDEHALEAPR